MAHDLTKPFSVYLLPGLHSVFTTGEDPNKFTMNADGTVSYDASLEGVFTGAGTTMLTIVGRAVSVDATGLGAANFNLDDVAHDPTKSFSVHLLPGQHSLFTLGTDPERFHGQRRRHHRLRCNARRSVYRRRDFFADHRRAAFITFDMTGLGVSTAPCRRSLLRCQQTGNDSPLAGSARSGFDDRHRPQLDHRQQRRHHRL